MTPDPLSEILKAHKSIAAHEKEVARLVSARAVAIREAMAAGVSVKDIADQLNVDRSRVYRMAKHNYADRRRV